MSIDSFLALSRGRIPGSGVGRVVVEMEDDVSVCSVSSETVRRTEGLEAFPVVYGAAFCLVVTPARVFGGPGSSTGCKLCDIEGKRRPSEDMTQGLLVQLLNTVV